jgi:RNA polymerase sigma-B factor
VTATSLAPEAPASPSVPGARHEDAQRLEVGRLEVVDRRPPGSTEAVRRLVEDHLDVATTMAARYRNRGIDLDDLQQVALLGLTKAAHRFDPDLGHDFMSFAVPTIRGELRRHFRDLGWVVRPPRRVQELQARISSAQSQLEQALGRSPRPSEVASHLGVSLDDVVEALSADGCFTPTSLDTPLDDVTTTIGDMIGEEDTTVEAVEAKVVLEPLIAELPARERRILFMRFYEERSQQDIADAVGLTQAQVSRILARLLTQLRSSLGGCRPAA